MRFPVSIRAQLYHRHPWRAKQRHFPFDRVVISWVAMTRSRAHRVTLVLLAAAGLCGGCNNLRRTGGARQASAADSFRPPRLDFPRLLEPQPLPAARVLHIFFTSNVVGDIEPCG
jgi:hypothetical protein